MILHQTILSTENDNQCKNCFLLPIVILFESFKPETAHKTT